MKMIKIMKMMMIIIDDILCPKDSKLSSKFQNQLFDRSSIIESVGIKMNEITDNESSTLHSDFLSQN